MPAEDIERVEAEMELQKSREEAARLESKLADIEDEEDHTTRNVQDRLKIAIRRKKEEADKRARDQEEIKLRAQKAKDEGEKRRLLQQLDGDNRDWEKRLKDETAL